MYTGVLIGTAILWGLNMIFVSLLTNLSLSRKMVAAGITNENFGSLSEDQKSHWKSVATGHYIIWDVIVLGTAGVMMGLLGYYFIGISFKLKKWPGMLAFIGASLLGVSLGKLS